MAPLSKIQRGHYGRCGTCRLIVLENRDHLSESAARARYETHRNDPKDPGYRKFFEPLVDALSARLKAPARILDYGTGTASALPGMLGERGYILRTYDPLFRPDVESLAERYDAVTCTETFEHFSQPAREFDKLQSLLRPGGVLAVMTLLLQPGQDFATWWYREDPTHVAFYEEETLRWIAGHWRWKIEILSSRLMLFSKQS